MTLRTAARTGLPRPSVRLEIARELEAMGEWLRLAGRPSASAVQPQPASQTVQIRHWKRHVKLPLQLRLDRRLWDALDQPAWLRLTVEGGQARLCPASAADGKQVRVGQAGPQLAYADGELPIGDGTYAAEVREGTIVIGLRLVDMDEPGEAKE